MRVVASYVAGVLTLLMILFSGGAWSLTDQTRLHPVQLTGVHAEFPYAGELPQAAEPEPVRPLPAGCRLALPGATCAVTVVAGGLDVPVDAYDLIPVRVGSVSDWRPLVEQFFEPHHVAKALRVIRCESGGDPLAKNPTSSASGLFQHLGSMWRSRSAAAGWAGADVFDPVANVAVAAWLVYDHGGWSHWHPSSGCSR